MKNPGGVVKTVSRTCGKCGVTIETPRLEFVAMCACGHTVLYKPIKSRAEKHEDEPVPAEVVEVVNADS